MASVNSLTDESSIYSDTSLIRNQETGQNIYLMENTLSMGPYQHLQEVRLSLSTEGNDHMEWT